MAHPDAMGDEYVTESLTEDFLFRKKKVFKAQARPVTDVERFPTSLDAAGNWGIRPGRCHHQQDDQHDRTTSGEASNLQQRRTLN